MASGRVEGIISNDLPNGKCRKCGWELDPRVAAQFEGKTKTAVDNTACVQCEQRIAQLQNELIRNEHLQNMFKAQLTSQVAPFIDSEHFVYVRETLKSNLLDDTEADTETNFNCRLDELINLLPSDPLLIKVINVQTQYHDATEYNAMKINIEGAAWVRREGEPDEHMTIKHDDNEYDATLALLQQPLISDTNFVLWQILMQRR